MRPEIGGKGGLLLVGEAPGLDEDNRGTPFVGASGKFLRKYIEKWWQGPVSYDNALRCHPDDTKQVKPKDITMCRGYLADTFRRVQPSRVIALGQSAALSILGRPVPMQSARYGYSWLVSEEEDAPHTPVFLVVHPAFAMRNRFHRALFEKNLQWALTAKPRAPMHWAGFTHVVETKEDAEKACSAVRQAPWFAFDVETYERPYNKNFRILCFSIAAKGSQDGWSWDDRALANEDTFAPLREILIDKDVHKIGQNVKFDCLAVRAAWGFTVGGIVGDTRLVRKLVDPEANGKLAVMAELVGMGGHKEEAQSCMKLAVRNERKRARKAKEEVTIDAKTSYALLPKDILLRYNALDSVSAAVLYDVLRPSLDARVELKTIWEDVVHPASLAIEQMEAWGIGVSREALLAFQSYLGARQEQIKARFAVYPEFNPDSHPSVRHLLFKQLKLRPGRNTDTGLASTSEAALTEIAENGNAHPIINDILEWRQVTKLKGTYADGMLDHISDDGRIHPNLKLDGARSGRISSSDPNMQNVRRPEDDESKMARDVFVAAPGFVLLQCDFCLAADTLVDTPKGAVSISAIQVGDLVYTYNHSTKKPDCSKVVRAKATGERATLVVTLDNGEKVRCTAEHRWLLKDGTEICAGDLQEGMSLLPLRRSYAGPKRYETLYSRSALTYVYTHKVVAAAKYGSLSEGLVVHHQDENSRNNDPTNLMVLTRHEHARAHRGNTVRQWRNAPLREQMRKGIRKALVQRGGHGGGRNPNFGNRRGKVLACCACNAEFYAYPSASGRKYCSQVCYRALRQGKAGLNHRVQKIERDGKVVATFDIEVERDHNFALSAGVFVHNSQIELRVAAMLSGDPAMIAIFKQGLDFHQRTAELIAPLVWKIQPAQVEKKHRSAAKAFNFGLLFGMGDAKLAHDLHSDIDTATRIRAAIMGQFKRLDRWISERLTEARTTGHVWTWWNGHKARCRPLLRIASQDDKERSRAENGAFNSPIQGTAADYCTSSIVEVVKWLTASGAPKDAKLVLAVHDSLLLEVREEHVKEVTERVCGIMTGWPTLHEVPLAVDVEVGSAWGSMKKI